MRLHAWTIFAALALALQAATAQDAAVAAPAPTAKSGKPRTIPFASLFTTLSTDKKSKFLELTKRMRMLKTLPKEEKASQSKAIDQEIHKVLGKASYAEYKALVKARHASKSAGKAGGVQSAAPVPGPVPGPAAVPASDHATARDRALRREAFLVLPDARVERRWQLGWAAATEARGRAPPPRPRPASQRTTHRTL